MTDANIGDRSTGRGSGRIHRVGHDGPIDRALNVAHKDVALARELGAELTVQELTEAVNQGRGEPTFVQRVPKP